MGHSIPPLVIVATFVIGFIIAIIKKNIFNFSCSNSPKTKSSIHTIVLSATLFNELKRSETKLKENKQINKPPIL